MLAQSNTQKQNTKKQKPATKKSNTDCELLEFTEEHQN